ncbi:AAA family ATPase [Candidatus Roizmanbacteria bacterium]|nr:AAA family ATPase [Candidatus Roizmanbacteria bacterium]
MTLSRDQKKAFGDVLEWYRKDKEAMPYITLGGYAGTGKTTFIAHLRKRLDKLDKKLKVGFASYTGKASRVLRNKLKETDTVMSQDTVGTIHSLIYSPIVDEKEQIIGWKTKDKIDRDLIIIDEASMVDGLIWQHLMAYKIPIIVVGDHGQLPPIKGNFNLMQKPHLKLEEIHRQAKHNPIIKISLLARENGNIPAGIYGDSIKKVILNSTDAQETVSELLSSYDYDTLVLCGYNKTRRKLNSFIRGALGFESPSPQSGDRVICLRNNHKDHIFNGMLGTIVTIENAGVDWYRAEIKMDEETNNFKGLISVKQFNSDTSLNFTDKRSEIMKGDLFDFGYALTVHKAQGSQAKRVILFEERFSQMTDDEWRRWLYTAVTRAEEELFIFSSAG